MRRLRFGSTVRCRAPPKVGKALDQCRYQSPPWKGSRSSRSRTTAILEYGSNGGTVITSSPNPARISTTVPAGIHAPPGLRRQRLLLTCQRHAPRALTGTTRAGIHRRADYSTETFFFLDYERFRDNAPKIITTSVNRRRADERRLLQLISPQQIANGNARQLYNPFAVTCTGHRPQQELH